MGKSLHILRVRRTISVPLSRVRRRLLVLSPSLSPHSAHPWVSGLLELRPGDTRGKESGSLALWILVLASQPAAV